MPYNRLIFPTQHTRIHVRVRDQYLFINTITHKYCKRCDMDCSNVVSRIFTKHYIPINVPDIHNYFYKFFEFRIIVHINYIQTIAFLIRREYVTGCKYT